MSSDVASTWRAHAVPSRPTLDHVLGRFFITVGRATVATVVARRSRARPRSRSRARATTPPIGGDDALSPTGRVMIRPSRAPRSWTFARPRADDTTRREGVHARCQRSLGRDDDERERTTRASSSDDDRTARGPTRRSAPPPMRLHRASPPRGWWFLHRRFPRSNTMHTSTNDTKTRP